ncbi:hypothetical protein FAVG1_08599 [Fusarium avenaceum]|nr:hypothetical protein FAVG1_08599 [Fusarium avenaceum]
MVNYGDATALGLLYWGQDDSQYEPSFDSILNPPNPDALFRTRTCNLSTSHNGPTFPSFQHLEPSSPGETYTPNLAFSRVSPPQDSNEIVVPSGHMTGPESMGIGYAGVTPAPAKKTALTRLPEKNSAGIKNINDYCDGNRAKIRCAPGTPIEPKLRSASRKPKRSQIKRTFPLITQRARECHNNVEKQYRTRLKLSFEGLLMVLQASRPEDKGSEEEESLGTNFCISRGEVLDAARQRILTLEEENKRLLFRHEGISLDLVVGKKY